MNIEDIITYGDSYSNIACIIIMTNKHSIIGALA